MDKVQCSFFGWVSLLHLCMIKTKGWRWHFCHYLLVEFHHPWTASSASNLSLTAAEFPAMAVTRKQPRAYLTVTVNTHTHTHTKFYKSKTVTSQGGFKFSLCTVLQRTWSRSATRKWADVFSLVQAAILVHRCENMLITTSTTHLKASGKMYWRLKKIHVALPLSSINL